MNTIDINLPETGVLVVSGSFLFYSFIVFAIHFLLNIYNGKHNSAEIIIGIRKLFITILTTLFNEFSDVYRAYERTDTGIAANIAAKN